MPADLQKVLPQGQAGWVTIILAGIAVLGSGAGWKFWQNREKLKLEEKKLEHEQKMKELELKADLAKAELEMKADDSKSSKTQEAAEKLKKKVRTVKKKR
jgi:uncharacterized protein HemX